MAEARAGGIVVSIHIAAKAEDRMLALQEARAAPGLGLEGDRYYKRIGTYSNRPGPDREITLIEAEALEWLRREHQIELDANETRRNVVVRGVALNDLVGKEFRVGEVRLRGIRLCEPCAHLDGLVGKSVSPNLVHRGGLRAQILAGGALRVGDPVEQI